MRALSYLITDIGPSASLADAVRAHWREYLMEAVELAELMLLTCLAGTLIYSDGSPLRRLALPPAVNAALMGISVAAATYLIIRSHFGRRSGAHLNPAMTLSYLWLGRIRRWDALNYVIAQFVGGLVGVFLARELLGRHLSAPPVHYVVTLPGDHGTATAFVAVFLLSGVLMGVVLFSTNHRRLTRFSPLFVALITVFFFILAPSIAGFSVNPARSFSSAFFSGIWRGIWVYFAAPSLGMLVAAALYLRNMGPSSIYCAKVFHDLHTTCPFPCRIHELVQERRM